MLLNLEINNNLCSQFSIIKSERVKHAISNNITTPESLKNEDGINRFSTSNDCKNQEDTNCWNKNFYKIDEGLIPRNNFHNNAEINSP